MKTLGSQQLCRQSRKMWPDPDKSPLKAFSEMDTPPLFFRAGKGALLYDQDYNAFTDYSLAGGTLILGHAHRNIVLAVKKAAERGIHFGAATKSELDLAQEILKAFPRMERISFTPTAEAAFEETLRLARMFTGRPLVVILGGKNVPDQKPGDACLHQRPEAANEAGQRAHAYPPVMTLAYDHIGQVEAILDPLKAQLAGVVVDPLLIGERVAVLGADEFKFLRSLTKKYKSLLLVNEISSGFRFHKGGLQEHLGISGDLTCLGKIIGGGFPLGAVGGRRDILSQVPARDDNISEEFPAANPVVMRAGLSTLRLLNNDVYRSMDSRAVTLTDGLNAFFVAENIPVRVSRVGSLLKLHSEPDGSPIPYPLLFQYLLKNKILWPPDAQQPFSLCAMHRSGDCERLAFLLRKFFQKAP